MRVHAPTMSIVETASQDDARGILKHECGCNEKRKREQHNLAYESLETICSRGNPCKTARERVSCPVIERVYINKSGSGGADKITNKEVGQNKKK